MPGRIQLLSPELANQIAAGEVVERPASVVKELLENSVDAGATKIIIELEDAGIGLIRVRDNGHGILKEDLAFAVKRHATSKISHFSDLMALKTLGFRGEALASIASVSKLSLSSCSQAAKHGYMVEVAGPSQDAMLKTVAHPVGTSIEVRDLFYNTPVRRKFLKGKRTELFHIQELISKVALSHPEVAFEVYQEQKKTHSWPAVSKQAWQQRIAQVLGKAFLEKGQAFSSQALDLFVQGWWVPPQCVVRHQEQLHTFVNERAVRDKLMNHAIKTAWLAQGGEQLPMQLVLFLNIDPARVDVNVHPTKHEVRFHEPSLVHDVIGSALAEVSLPVQSTLLQKVHPPTLMLRSAGSTTQQSSIFLNKITPVTTALALVPSNLKDYSLVSKDQELWLLDPKKIAAWWLLESFEKQMWIEKKLLSPEVFILEPNLLNFLMGEAGTALLAKLKISGRVLGKDQWVLEGMPEILVACDPRPFIEQLFLSLSKNIDCEALTYVLAWTSLAGPEIFSESVAEKVLALPLNKKQELAMLLDDSGCAKMFAMHL